MGMCENMSRMKGILCTVNWVGLINDSEPKLSTTLQ